MTEIFLVDDNAFMRKAMRQLIELEEGLKVCGEAGSAEDAIKILEWLKPDVALVDISLGGNEQGIELIKYIRTKKYKFPVLTVSLHDEALYLDRVLKAGAQGYLMKQEAPESIIRAIHHVAAKEETFFTSAT